MTGSFLTPMLSWDQSPEYSSGHGQPSILPNSNTAHGLWEPQQRKPKHRPAQVSTLGGLYTTKQKGPAPSNHLLPDQEGKNRTWQVVKKGDRVGSASLLQIHQQNCSQMLKHKSMHIQEDVHQWPTTHTKDIANLRVRFFYTCHMWKQSHDLWI